MPWCVLGGGAIHVMKRGREAWSAASTPAGDKHQEGSISTLSAAFKTRTS